MTNQSNVIELSGGRYDALTGGPVETGETSVRGTSSPSFSQASRNSFASYQPQSASRAPSLSAAPAQPVAPVEQRPVETYDSARIYQHSTQPVSPAGYVQTAPAISTAPAPVAPVTPAQPAVPPVTPFVPIRMLQQSQTAPAAAATEPVAEVAPVVETVTKAAPAVHRAVRASAKHAARHKPQATKTLQRHAVKAPETASHSHHTSQSARVTSVPAHAKPDVSVRTTLTSAAHRAVASHAGAVRTDRHQRAQAVVQSNMVDRFRKQPLPRVAESEARPAASPLAPAQAPAQAVEPVQAVQNAPVQQAAPAIEPRPFSALEAAAAATAASRQLDVAAPAQAAPTAKEEPRLWPAADRYLSRSRDEADIDQEDDVELENIPEAAIPSLLDDNGAETSADRVFDRPYNQVAEAARPIEPVSKFAKVPVQEDVFERALAVANGHQEQPIKQSKLQQPAKRAKKPRHLARWATSAAVLLLLVGFVAFQNRGSIQLQMASAKAGFAASAPGYKPSGFAMAKISYSPGTVATDYEHDDKTFSVIQKKSTWDSQALLDNFVATSNEAYQGYESNGRTIYVYGSGRATWVKDGIWYQIHADNVLSNEQLVKIAASM